MKDEPTQALWNEKAEEIGRNLTTIMEEAGNLDVPTVARLTGVSRSEVADILNGKKLPILPTLYALSRGLKVSIRRLVPMN